MAGYAMATDNYASFNPDHVAWLAERKARMDAEAMDKAAKSMLPTMMAETSIATEA